MGNFIEPDNKWVDISKVIIVSRGKNSQLRAVITCKDGNLSRPCLSLREFNKYLRKEDYEAGRTLDECFYTPNPKRGCTIPLDNAEELLNACLGIVTSTKNKLAERKKA